MRGRGIVVFFFAEEETSLDMAHSEKFYTRNFRHATLTKNLQATNLFELPPNMV